MSAIEDLLPTPNSKLLAFLAFLFFCYKMTELYFNNYGVC